MRLLLGSTCLCSLFLSLRITSASVPALFSAMNWQKVCYVTLLPVTSGISSVITLNQNRGRIRKEIIEGRLSQGAAVEKLLSPLLYLSSRVTVALCTAEGKYSSSCSYFNNFLWHFCHWSSDLSSSSEVRAPLIKLTKAAAQIIAMWRHSAWCLE